MADCSTVLDQTPDTKKLCGPERTDLVLGISFSQTRNAICILRKNAASWRGKSVPYFVWTDLVLNLLFNGSQLKLVFAYQKRSNRTSVCKVWDVRTERNMDWRKFSCFSAIPYNKQLQFQSTRDKGVNQSFSWLYRERFANDSELTQLMVTCTTDFPYVFFHSELFINDKAKVVDICLQMYCLLGGNCLLGGIDGCLLVEPPALVLVFIYQARQNAIYTANALLGTKWLVTNKVSIPGCFGRDKHAPALWINTNEI